MTNSKWNGLRGYKSMSKNYKENINVTWLEWLTKGYKI